MVCDHCHGHGLPCNEAPVCEQCIISDTACTHRLCAESPAYKDECTNLECRYVHKDYMPLSDAIFDKYDYIVLPGRLRRYLVDGKLNEMEWSGYGLVPRHQKQHREEAQISQSQARQLLDSMVADGVGPLKKLYLSCGKGCR